MTSSSPSSGVPGTASEPGAARGRTAGAAGRAAALLAAVMVLASACGSSPGTAPTTSQPDATGAVPSSTTAPVSTAPAGVPVAGAPVVPATGAYLGAWLHPVPRGTEGAAFAVEQRTLPTVRAATGRAPAILHVYSAWSDPAPVTSLSAVAAAGAIPLLDWGCGPDVATIAGGGDDATITAFARALRHAGTPVLLRWCWEMNLVRSHPQIAAPTDFTAAWLHLRSLFRAAGATNVSFVWCPALSGVDPAPYYPGDGAVDWIGVDGYDRDGTQTFSSLFGPFHATWVTHGKPMIVAETGAAGAAQPEFIASIGTGMPTLPGFKGVVWFDAPGPALDWSFTPAGLQAFAALAREPYFSPG